jgi:hypothetical protein
MIMKSTMKILAVAVLALGACGDNKAGRADAQKADGPPADAQCSNCPAAPMLGAQIDRMGRPTINTVLTHGFNGNATTAQAAKKAYNENADPATWTSFVPEFMKNLGIVDSLDTGFCGNALCEVGEANAAGAGNVACPADCPTAAQVGTIATACGNQALYNGTGMGGPVATSYQTLAGVLAADELYLDTSKGLCAFYLAVEFGVVTGGTNSTCGGRAPQYDVIDFTLSLGAVGLAGFATDGTFAPDLRDGATAHTDLSPTFPFLGVPH